MTNPTEIVAEFLQNTAPDKIEAAAKRLVAEDATYISLNFDNPELKKILPWTGTSKRREAYTSTFIRVAKYWTIEDFWITALFGSGEDVAVFGSFTYRSNSRGKSFRSPLSIHAKVKDGKIVHFQFMEDTFASSRSFSSGGTWTIKTDPNGPEYQVWRVEILNQRNVAKNRAKPHQRGKVSHENRKLRTLYTHRLPFT